MSPPRPRYELKYWCAPAQAREVFDELAPLLERDAHCSHERPRYAVTSLYLDTVDLTCFLEKVEGLRVRSKLRLRRYGELTSGFAELKAKRGRRLRKWRVPLAAADLERVARGDVSALEAAPEQEAARKLLHEHTLRELGPAVITRYDREAWVFRDDPTIRVTLDTDLRCWGSDLVESFLSPRVTEMPMLLPESEGAAILEVKVSTVVPGPVSMALRRVGLRFSAISKYCLAVQGTRPLPAPLLTFPMVGPQPVSEGE